MAIKIGVALGSGVARGWAHIGVLKTLADAGVRPEIIAGTSIGAVAGACFAANKMELLEEFARSMTPRQVFRYLDVNFAGSGILHGNRLGKKLEETLGLYRIEDLPTTFAAVATELGSGREIWLTRGPLVQALRASYALPGVFKPVCISGRWLIDGALVNPIPVSVCRAMGAELVIAINLHGDGPGRTSLAAQELVPNDGDDGTEMEAADDETAPPRKNGPMAAMKLLHRQLFGKADGAPGISRVMMEAFNISQDRIARSRMAGDPPDVTITVRLGGMGLFDFHRAAFAIAEGRTAALRRLDEIEHHLRG
jgi:NTE family protein